ncbi:restriction endonuclease subunit S, partial [Comamonas aquatica]|uniref:restriction endonuclease subunit S n=1 Tax=Comamonas aquatica TaxID=225991 RepID=UPI00244AF59C
MSALPARWAMTSIADIALFNPKTVAEESSKAAFAPMQFLGMRYRDRMAFEERPWGEIKKAYVHFQPRDVIVAKVTPCFENGKAGVVPPLPNSIGAGSSEFCVFRPARGIDERYLLAWLSTEDFRRRATVAMTGSVGLKRVPKEVFLSEQIPLAPEAEQKRIADKLDAVLTRVDAVNTRLARIAPLLKRFRQSVLAAATSGRLTEDWRGANGLSNPWPLVLLGEVARDFSYGSAAKSSPAGNVPVLRMGNIQEGALDWSDLVFTSDPAEIAKYRLQDGDVLFNRTNSPELVGKTAVFRGKREAIYAGYLIRVRCSSDLLPDYLNYCLGSPAGKHYCWQVKSDGVSQSNINAKKLAAFSFGLPRLDEQTE